MGDQLLPMSYSGTVKCSQLSSHWDLSDGGVDSPASIRPMTASADLPAAGLVHGRDHIVIGQHSGPTAATVISEKPCNANWNGGCSTAPSTSLNEQLSTHWDFSHPSNTDQPLRRPI